MTHDVHKNIRAFHGSRGFQNLAGRVGSGRVGSGRVITFQISRVGSGQEVSKSRGLGRVGSIGFQNLVGRVGSGRVGSGRIGSGQEVSKSRGPGRVMTRKIRVTRGSSHHDLRAVLG